MGTFSAIVDNATAVDAYANTFGSDVHATSGVGDIQRGDGLVTENSSPNASVLVAEGEFYVPYSAYTPGGRKSKFAFITLDGSENPTITANASGNPRIDLVCVKYDSGATPGDDGAGAASIVVTEGTPAASPAIPATPADSLPLAYILVQNGFSSITDSDITDVRWQSNPRTLHGWEHSEDSNGDAIAWTYQSADDPTYVMRLTGTDVSAYYSAGMRVWVNQGGTDKYFIITKVTGGSNTDLTLYGGTDYDLANSAISFVYFSSVKAPLGFPLDPDKWTVEVTNSSFNSQSSPTANIWYNPGTITIDIPIGVWDVVYQAAPYSNIVSTDIQIFMTLSTANNSESDTEWTTYGRANIGGNGSNTLIYSMTQNRGKVISITTKDTYYLNIKTSTSSVSSIAIAGNNSLTIIRAVCAYL